MALPGGEREVSPPPNDHKDRFREKLKSGKKLGGESSVDLKTPQSTRKQRFRDPMNPNFRGEHALAPPIE